MIYGSYTNRSSFNLSSFDCLYQFRFLILNLTRKPCHKCPRGLVGWFFWVKRHFETVFQPIPGRLQYRGRKKREVLTREKMSKKPTHTYCTPNPPTPTAHLLPKLIRRPGTGSLPNTRTVPDHPSSRGCKQYSKRKSNLKLKNGIYEYIFFNILRCHDFIALCVLSYFAGLQSYFLKDKRLYVQCKQLHFLFLVPSQYGSAPKKEKITSQTD